MDLGTEASLAGIILTSVVAAYQTWQVHVAKRDAAAEKARVATLEQYLDAQRWQQLRSIADQVDALEQAGVHDVSAKDAAAHARLKVQYSSTMSMIATGNRDLSAKTVRGWVETGRISRPWHVGEALIHLDPAREIQSEDMTWLLEHAKATGAVRDPKPIEKPIQLTARIAAYILLAQRNLSTMTPWVFEPGAARTQSMVLLWMMAGDCVALAKSNGLGKPNLNCWGPDKTFMERYRFYADQDFSLMWSFWVDSVLSPIGDFSSYFRDGTLLAPTDAALETARLKFPRIAEESAKFPS